MASKLNPASFENFKKENDFLIGYVGRIDIYTKGLDLLLEAIAILKQKHSYGNVKLLFVGPYFTKRDRKLLNLMIKNLDLHSSVLLVGEKYDEEKVRYFQAFDVFVHPSRFEGMPMAVLEAMALGCPCLATSGSNMADVIERNGGWKCEANPDSIARAIKEIYEARDILKQVGEKLKYAANKNYSWDNIASRLKDEYRRLLTEK